MNIKKTNLMATGLIFSLMVLLAMPFACFADWNFGLDLAENYSGLPSGLFVDEVIFNVLLWLLLIFTFLAVISFVVTGLMFILSGGGEMATRAKKGVSYSIIGVAVGLSGYIIINQINEFLTGYSFSFF